MNERTLRARMLLGEEAMEKLAGSHVAVFGLGGVGSWCAEALARAGVGRLTLIDQDTVGESNINRQLCALTSTVGMPKAEVVRQRLEDKSLGLEITDGAKQLIIDRGFDPVFGARPLKRYLQSTVETLIARAILAGDMPAGHVIKVDVRDGELVCE